MEEDAESLLSEKEEEEMKNIDILKEAQAKIIARGENPYYPVEQHLIDMDLIADLTLLIGKYKIREAERSR